MTSLAFVPAGAESVLETEEDDDMTPVGLISKSIKLGPAGQGLPHGSPKRFSSIAGTESMKVPESSSQTEEFAEDGMTKVLAAIANLSGIMESMKMEMKADANEVKRSYEQSQFKD